MGASLVMVGRNADCGVRIRRELQTRFPSAQMDFCRTDLSSLAEVRELAAGITARHGHVDVLINNAGARYDRYHESRDGFELTFATNHLGHFLLTCLLWDCLAASPAARIITVSSSAHAAARTDGVWLPREQEYDGRQAYAKSKLANILFAFELARRMASTGGTSNAVHPGGVATNFARNNGLLSWLKHLVAHGMKGELVSPTMGAKTILYLATDSEVAGISGRYYFQRRTVDPAPAVLDPTLAAALWNSSLQWTKVDKSIGMGWNYLKPANLPAQNGVCGNVASRGRLRSAGCKDFNVALGPAPIDRSGLAFLLLFGGLASYVFVVSKLSEGSTSPSLAADIIGLRRPAFGHSSRMAVQLGRILLFIDSAAASGGSGGGRLDWCRCHTRGSGGVRAARL